MRGVILLFISVLTFYGCAPVQPSLSKGTVMQFASIPSQYVAPRNIEVYYPPAFNPSDRYAIVLMHDGQNVFNDSTAYSGHAWHVNDVLDSLYALNQIQPAIVVAVSNSPNRWSEYLPEVCVTVPIDSTLTMPYARPELWRSGVYSDAYLAFLVDEILPFIHTNVLPKSQWQNLYCMGSSMGGLISAYAVCAYPEIFQGAACLSTHWPALQGNCLPYFQHTLATLKDNRMYFDYGSVGLDSLYAPYQKQLDSAMHAAGVSKEQYTSAFFPGADHNERSWHKRVAEPLLFLLAKP